MHARGGPGTWRGIDLISVLLSVGNMLLGLGALCWLGMWFGLKSRWQVSGILWTIGLARGVPFLISTIGAIFLRAWVGVFGLLGFPGGAAPLAYLLIAWSPHLLILFLYLWLIRGAKQRLSVTLAGKDPESFADVPTLSNAFRDIAVLVREGRNLTRP